MEILMFPTAYIINSVQITIIKDNKRTERKYDRCMTY